ncbi:MAG: PKD domain-containing protein [Chlorobi bacterium]|nr:PKD domain-containing protein [Chlorobiota bacterium]
MKMLNHNIVLFTTIVISVLFSQSSTAQLSGEYSLGNPESDFKSFADAISALKSEGLGGDVTFKVVAGNYNNVSVIDVENPDNNNIEFVYYGAENDSAVIVGRLKVFRTAHVTFNNFTIYPSENQDYSCIWSDESPYFQLLGCNILNLFNNSFDYDEALIKIEYPWEGPYLVTNIDSCKIVSEQQTFYIGGSKGSSWFRHNTIYGGIVNKSVKNRFSQYRHFIDNVFYASTNDFVATGQSFHSNTFYYDGIYTFALQGNLYFNTFYCNVNVRAGDIIGNVFNGSVELDWLNNANFYNNFVHGRLSSTFSNGIKIKNNYLYENCDINNDNTIFGNNFVFDTVDFSHGPGQMIFHNNFSEEAYLEMNYTGGAIKNNNISNMNIWQPSVTTIENNNFIRLGHGNVSTYGSSAHFYDPLYLADSSLYASSPALIGKGGKKNSNFKYDIDSVLRKNPSTIGANEICFNWQLSDIEIKCSDSLCLDLCLDTLENMYWSPSRLFSDSTSTNPTIYPENSTMVYLMSGQGQELDSLKIKVGSSPPIASATYSNEGLLVSFENLSICGDTFLWEFGDGESSGEESPVHEYREYGTYQCNLKVSNEIADDYFAMLIEIVTIGENQDLNKTMSIFPNPVTSDISIKSDVPFDELRIYDSHGTLVYNELTGNTKYYKINVRYLENGFYIIGLKTREGVTYRKFTISG